MQLVQGKVNPLVHFGLCDATRSSPIVRFFSTQGVEPELRHAAREFFLNGGVEIDLESRTVHLTRIIKWSVHSHNLISSPIGAIFTEKNNLFRNSDFITASLIMSSVNVFAT